MVLAGQDAWRKHPLISGCWKKPLPGLGLAIGLFTFYCKSFVEIVLLLHIICQYHMRYYMSKRESRFTFFIVFLKFPIIYRCRIGNLDLLYIFLIFPVSQVWVKQFLTKRWVSAFDNHSQFFLYRTEPILLSILAPPPSHRPFAIKYTEAGDLGDSIPEAHRKSGHH